MLEHFNKHIIGFHISDLKCKIKNVQYKAIFLFKTLFSVNYTKYYTYK